jgi:membrane fusion protein (multidrug efflux system)
VKIPKLHAHSKRRSVPERARIAVLIACLALAGCSSSGEQDAAGKGSHGPTKVGFVMVQPTSVPLEISLGGRAVAFETSEVRPQVNGLIRRRNFTEGSYVRQGQPLFQVDPSLYQAAVAQAAANVASARANADAARVKADRYRPLAQMEAISKQDYTDAAAQARAARAAVAQNGAALRTAQINLRFTNIPAPISGRIGRSLFTVGALVTASQADPLAVITRVDPIYVDIQESSADLTTLRKSLAVGGVQPGSTQVRLKLEDGSDYGYTGTVQFSEIVVNQSTGTVTLRARFPNPQGLLLPGAFVQALFTQAVDTNVYLVPQQALKRDIGGEAYVFVVGAGNKALRRNVTATRAYRDDWVVTTGIAPGDRIITQGTNALKAGGPIKPVPASAKERVQAGKGEAGKRGGAGASGG